MLHGRVSASLACAGSNVVSRITDVGRAFGVNIDLHNKVLPDPTTLAESYDAHWQVGIGPSAEAHQ